MSPRGISGPIAPDIFVLECAHVLTKAQRRGLIRDAQASFDTIMLDVPSLYSSLPLVSRAMEIASKARIGVYDCLYVALAEREGCDLIHGGSSAD